MTKSRGILPARRPWFDVEERLLRESFADSRTEDIAAALGRTYAQVAQRAAKLGLKKSAAYLTSPMAGRLNGVRGLTSRFVKGQPSWNKGLHYQPGGRAAESQFKPGVCSGRAANLWRPVGTFRINCDGYLDLKVSDEPGPQHHRWKAYHRLIWEEANGPVPAGHVVVFKPGRSTTVPAEVTLDRLDCVTRQELMRRNSYHTNYPPEVAKLIQLRGAINRQINKRAKHGQQEHQ